MLRRLVVLLLLLAVLLPRETISADGDRCSRRCGGTTVPYPFGFSPGCPIALNCDASTSTSSLPYTGNDGTTYRVTVFNHDTSTIVVTLPPSCSRSVPDVRSALSDGNYGVSSSTGLFLRGGCRSNDSTTSTCTVPEDVMSRLLRTARCGNDTSVACLASSAVNANGTATGDKFLRWEKAEKSNCEDVLTSTLFMYTPEGTTSLEFGVAELGWWLNGTCTGGVERCAANATCSDVHTLGGAVGHRCTCLAGMDGDGFAAGDGCYLKSQESLFRNVFPLRYSVIQRQSQVLW